MRNKRGQFYLIAAIVIIAIVVGFETLSNFFNRGVVDEKKVYFLSKELDIEGAYVIDYSVFKGNEAVILLEQFAQDYGQYAGDERNIWFVFGNSENIYVATYEEVLEETITISGTGTPINYDIIGKGFKIDKRPRSGEVTKVTVTINLDGEDVDYEFPLKAGENFYFVISQDVEGRGRIVLDKPKGE